MFRRVFDAAELMPVEHVARNADDKQIADRGVKDLLRDDARVGAADHNRVRVLTVLGGVLQQRTIDGILKALVRLYETGANVGMACHVRLSFGSVVWQKGSGF